ncbi:MAG TPA: hypothetical protein VKD91_11440 [Pyrinomonadaceae bacterium]|nr:hypothetical protein [Pyrinomonadaceae bacterium]
MTQEGQRSEQWCPQGQLPSRSKVLLSRTRWPGPLGAPASAFPDAHAQQIALQSFVRPGMQVLKADDRTAVWLLALRQDVLMGDSWQVRLVSQGDEVSTSCTVEMWEPAPRELDAAPVKLVVDLVSAPDGVFEPDTALSREAVESQIAAVLSSGPAMPIESWLEALDQAIAAAESLPPSLESCLCLGTLATRLADVPGAAFLGLADEAVRLHRINLRRVSREAQRGLWAFSIRGALLALAQVTPVDRLASLITACRAAIGKGQLSAIERATLHYCEGELLLRDQDRESCQAALQAYSLSGDAATEMGVNGGSYLFLALTGLARANRALGQQQEETAALKIAVQFADETARPGIETRLQELATAGTAPPAEPGMAEVNEFLQTEQARLNQRTTGQLLLRTPFKPAPTINVLVLRPLITANASGVPNRFVNPFRHAWRFPEEPPTLTFEETLSRALGHFCSFASRGGDQEGFGIGRLSSLPSDEAQQPDMWKTLVKVMVVDEIISPIVLVYPSDSPGMQWELDLLTSSKCEQQTRLFMIPPDVNDDGAKRWSAAQQVLSARELDIPAWHPDGLIFRNDPNGKVAWTETFEMLWDGRLASLIAAKQDH